MRKKISVLGSTGSIGTQTLEVAEKSGIEIHALSAHKNIDLLAKQVCIHSPKFAVITDHDSYKKAKEANLFGQTEILYGEEGLFRICSEAVDMVVNALVGFSGLKSTLDIIKSGNDQAFANKESMVIFGEQLMKMAKKYKTSLIPVDSEHSAIFQCLQGEERKLVNEIILTASGGPFVDMPIGDLRDVTVAQTLDHPNWKMGNKITVDSATMMNKGLEVIEARYLFDIEPDRIKAVIHKESIIHSIVGFIDGSYKAQLSVPDMKLPIAYALYYPKRSTSMIKPLDFEMLGSLSFKKVDQARYPCFKLAYDSLRYKNSMRVVLNAANEACVDAFLSKQIGLLEIPEYIEKIMLLHNDVTINTYEEILKLNNETLDKVDHMIGGR